MLSLIVKISRGTPMISPKSVKDKLTNRANLDKRLFSEILVMYAIERLLYRVSVSNYSKLFVLKGGVLMYGLFLSNYPRSTSDMDFLGLTDDQSMESIRKVFHEILSIEYDDALVFDLDSLSVGKIAELAETPGIRVKCFGYIERTRIPVSIDIGFSDVIYPESMLTNFPTLLSMEPPLILTYPIESVISEKFHAIFVLGKANSRYKDFYDIYSLICNFDFRGYYMKESLIRTFRNRNTNFGETVAFGEDFYKDEVKIRQWSGFLEKKHIDSSIEFEVIINLLKVFFLPILNSLIVDDHFDYDWSHEEKKWLRV